MIRLSPQPVTAYSTTSVFGVTPPTKKVALRQEPPRFGGMAGNAHSFGERMLRHFDFREAGVSHVNQIQIIYASCILWRLIAANERRKASPNKSWNEIRESALRDSLGYAFWFFGTPLLQRAYLQMATRNNPALRKALIQRNPDARDFSTLKGMLKAINPLTSLNIPTSEQVKDQMEQALHDLRQTGARPTDKAFLTTEQYYKELMKHRNLATGLGLGCTILLLGIGINFLNFYLTQKNVERRNAAQHKPMFPSLPPLPKLSNPFLAPAPQQIVPSFQYPAMPMTPPVA